MIKKIKGSLLTTLITSLLLLSVVVVQAQTSSDKDTVLDGLNTTAGHANVSKVGQELGPTFGLTTFFGTVINALFGLVAVIFLAVTMTGGFMWMAAQGAEDQISKAKKYISNGLLGLMAIFLSYGLVYLLLFYLNEATKK